MEEESIQGADFPIDKGTHTTIDNAMPNWTHDNYTETTGLKIDTTYVPSIQTPTDIDPSPESPVTDNRDIKPLIDITNEGPEVVKDQRTNSPASRVIVPDNPQSSTNATIPYNNQLAIVRIHSSDVDPSPTLSQNSQDTAIVTSAEDQLLSIPPTDDPFVTLPDQPKTTLPIKSPMSLAEFIDHIDPGTFFRYFQIHEIIAARTISQIMKTTVDDYFLHRILPWAEITFRSNYLHTIQGRLERETENLTPVIRRVEKQKRFLPHGRVLFEPTDKDPPYYYWHGIFKPVAVDFRLRDGSEYTWDLIPTADTNALPNRNDRRTAHLLTIPIFKHQKIYQYYKFQTFKDSPAQIFYKDRIDSDAPGFRLHALSFPLKWLQQALYNQFGIRKNDERDGRSVAQ
jgi:hypothetical protein